LFLMRFRFLFEPPLRGQPPAQVAARQAISMPQAAALPAASAAPPDGTIIAARTYGSFACAAPPIVSQWLPHAAVSFSLPAYIAADGAASAARHVMR
jgi:hypothetical protein